MLYDKGKKTEPIDLNNKQRVVLVKGELYFLRNVCCIKQYQMRIHIESYFMNKCNRHYNVKFEVFSSVLQFYISIKDISQLKNKRKKGKELIQIFKTYVSVNSCAKSNISISSSAGFFGRLS